MSRRLIFEWDFGALVIAGFWPPWKRRASKPKPPLPIPLVDEKTPTVAIEYIDSPEKMPR